MDRNTVPRPDEMSVPGPMAEPKTLRYLRSDFCQLTDKSIDLFAPFTERAKRKPMDRWDRPQVFLERPGPIPVYSGRKAIFL